MEASYHFLKINIHTNISSDYIVATMKKQVQSLLRFFFGILCEDLGMKLKYFLVFTNHGVILKLLDKVSTT